MLDTNQNTMNPDRRQNMYKYMRILAFVFVILIITTPFLFIQNQMVNREFTVNSAESKSFLETEANAEVELYGLILKADQNNVYKIVVNDQNEFQLIYSSKIDLGMLVGNKVSIKGYRKITKPANVEMIEVNSIQFK